MIAVIFLASIAYTVFNMLIRRVAVHAAAEKTIRHKEMGADEGAKQAASLDMAMYTISSSEA